MPAVPWDTTLYCCELEGGFIASLLGLGEILKLYRMWDGTDEQIQAQMEQVEKGLLALMGSGCCDGVEAVLTNKAGYLVSIDQEGNQTILGDTYSRESLASFPSEQPTDLPGDNICAGSRMLVERVLADVLFALDQAQFMVDQYKTASEGLSLLLNTIPLVSVTMGDAFDAWEEWVIAATGLTISTLKIAFSDPAIKDKMTENVYCNTMASPNNMLTYEIYLASASDLPLLETQGAILQRFIASFEIAEEADAFPAIRQWFLLGALNEDNTCEAQFECEDLPDPGCLNWLFVSAGAVTATADNIDNATYSAEKARDNDTDGGQDSRWATGTTGTHWLQFDTTVPQDVRTIDWWLVNFTNENPITMLVQVKVLGDDDNWIDIAEWADFTEIASRQMRCLLDEVVLDVMTIRFTITTSSGYGSCAEVKISACSPSDEGFPDPF